MSGGEEDLSGHWAGIFNYPSLFPPNNFEAELRDAAGLVTGLITQPREVFDIPGPSRQAVIEGQRTGSQLDFIKIYDDLDRPTVHYSGTIQPGGDEIEGIWTIPGDWSGTFLMVRARREEAAEERKLEEKVPAGRQAAPVRPAPIRGASGPESPRQEQRLPICGVLSGAGTGP